MRKTLAAVFVVGVVVALAYAASGLVGAPQPQAAAMGEVERAAEERIATVRDRLVDALRLKEDEYWHEQDLEPILWVCDQIIQLDPEFVDVYIDAAFVAVQLGRDALALEFYRRGMEANPDDYEILLDLGVRFYTYHKKDVKAAVPYLARAADLAPREATHIRRTYAHTLTKVGQQEEQAGDHAQAREYYQQAAAQWRRVLEIDPNDRFAPRELERLRSEGKLGPGN